MNDLIDKVSEMIYVVDIDTYELQFMNEAGKSRFGIADVRGRKCYEVLHDKTQPCEFCNNCQLSDQVYITWECENKKVGRHYLLKDSLIDWNGKSAKVEIACDITEQDQQKEALREMLEGQNIIMECVQMLHSADIILDVLDLVIEKIGRFARAKRAYIYENCPEEGVDQAHVWYSPEVPAEKRGKVREECGLPWRRNVLFEGPGCAVVKDIQRIRNQNPSLYEAMISNEITSFVAAPLELEEKCIGFIEIDNPPEESIDKIAPLISTLAYFLSSCMCICKTRLRLERLSYTDSLTGVMNRNAYNQRVKELEAGYENGVGVVYIDVNDMKGINDRFGHSFGDHILVELAGRIAREFERKEIFRINGDEFVVICQAETKIPFTAKVQSMIRALKGQEEFDVSIGYQWSENQENIKNLIAVSDRMMYENKKGFYFDRPMPRHCRYQYDEIKELLNPDTLEQELERGGFLVYIQPKMAVDGQRLIGAEALVRYQRRNGGLISPDRFIPLLEEYRLIEMVDFYVFDTVCGQIASWARSGVSAVPVSVNFSRHSLMEVSFLEQLERIASSHGIDRRLVEIEVTESADTDESFDLLGMIAKIRKAGFAVSIDDFGVKYANLFLFATVDFDVLKIDKSLAKDLVQNEKARSILQSVSDICKRIGIDMIVEGIETEEQLKILEGMGCYGVQGYYFSRPIPIPDFEERYMRQGKEIASA